MRKRKKALFNECHLWFDESVALIVVWGWLKIDGRVLWLELRIWRYTSKMSSKCQKRLENTTLQLVAAWHMMVRLENLFESVNLWQFHSTVDYPLQVEVFFSKRTKPNGTMSIAGCEGFQGFFKWKMLSNISRISPGMREGENQHQICYRHMTHSFFSFLLVSFSSWVIKLENWFSFRVMKFDETTSAF